jgi:hypothetical protein
VGQVGQVALLGGRTRAHLTPSRDRQAAGLAAAANVVKLVDIKRRRLRLSPSLAQNIAEPRCMIGGGAWCGIRIGNRKPWRQTGLAPTGSRMFLLLVQE